jgi:hypothetical protein
MDKDMTWEELVKLAREIESTSAFYPERFYLLNFWFNKNGIFMDCNGNQHKDRTPYQMYQIIKNLTDKE